MTGRERPRFRLWMVMALVAVVALGFGADRAWRRSAQCDARAKTHWQAMRYRAIMVASFEGHRERFRWSDTVIAGIVQSEREQSAYHEAMAAKWDRGASRFWENVEPDTPPPEPFDPVAAAIREVEGPRLLGPAPAGPN